MREDLDLVHLDQDEQIQGRDVNSVSLASYLLGYRPDLVDRSPTPDSKYLHAPREDVAQRLRAIIDRG